MNDNRNYIYSLDSISKRSEYSTITSWVRKGSSIIDLGSGDGTLLRLLKQKKDIKGFGLEISKSGVESAKNKGIKSIKGRIDVRLPFRDKEFDYAICNVTVQMVMYPEVLISEMVRISKKQIISFPNFAFFLNRLDLLFNGRMPRFMIPGYKWYSTGHIHQLSVTDFETFCSENSIKILDRKHTFPDRPLHFRVPFIREFPNLFALNAVFLTTGQRK
jgi:methionine biosynthesis protein MetW